MSLHGLRKKPLKHWKSIKNFSLFFIGYWRKVNAIIIFGNNNTCSPKLLLWLIRNMKVHLRPVTHLFFIEKIISRKKALNI